MLVLFAHDEEKQYFVEQDKKKRAPDALSVVGDE
jgi:hypothetical protein